MYLSGLIIGRRIGSGAIILFLVLSITYIIHRIMTQKKRMRQNLQAKSWSIATTISMPKGRHK
jgi:Ca2+/Na+ antiporter